MRRALLFLIGSRPRNLRWLVFILALAPTTGAQVRSAGVDPDPSSGMRQGRNTIVGQVIYPSGVQADKRVTVRLSSVRVGEFTTMTDENGVFTFRRLIDGSYRITVEAGKDYLPANETVDLYDNTGRTTTLQVQLRAKPGTQGKASVVNAVLIGVPQPAADLYNQARATAATGDIAKAVEQMKAAIALYPKFVLALNELSILYLRLNDFEKAADTLAEATKVDPNNFTLRLNHGYCLMQLKKFAEADAELHQATQLTDTSTIAHLYRGRVLIALAKYDDAEKELRRVIALGGDHVPMAYRYLGALYSEQGDTARAIESLEKYISMTPKAKDVDDVREVIKQLQAKLRTPQ